MVIDRIDTYGFRSFNSFSTSLWCRCSNDHICISDALTAESGSPGT